LGEREKTEKGQKRMERVSQTRVMAQSAMGGC